MKTKLLLGIIVCFSFASIYAQQQKTTTISKEEISLVEAPTLKVNEAEPIQRTKKIVGIIKNQNGDKLPGVKIIYDKDKVTYTDFAGEFTLKTKSENFNIELKYLNYFDSIIEFYAVDNVYQQKIEFVMKETKN